MDRGPRRLLVTAGAVVFSQQIVSDCLHNLATVRFELLTLARAGDGAPVRTHPVVVGELLADCVARYTTARVPVTMTHLGASEPGTELTARASREDLVRVLTNLIDNAVRHAASGVIVAALVHGGVPVSGFSLGTPSLEDTFVALTGEGFDVSG